MTLTILEQAWQILDSHMDEIALFVKDHEERFSTDDELFISNLRGKARGVAEILALWMVPHYKSANEIAQEAVRRQRARQAEDDKYETQGLGKLMYSPPPGDDVTKYKREPVNPAKEIAGLVSVEDAEKITRAYGTFPTDALAKAYKCKEADIEKIVKEMKRRAGSVASVS